MILEHENRPVLLGTFIQRYRLRKLTHYSGSLYKVKVYQNEDNVLAKSFQELGDMLGEPLTEGSVPNLLTIGLCPGMGLVVHKPREQMKN